MKNKPRFVIELDPEDLDIIHQLKIWAVTNRMSVKKAVLLAISELIK